MPPPPSISARLPSYENTPLLGSVRLGGGPSAKVLSETLVYPLIHQIRVDVLAHIDTPLTYEQLLSPESTYTIVRPLTDKYLELENQATVFCLLLNRVQFTRDSYKLSISTLSTTRATLCEILAIRVLRGWSERSLPLATVLLTPWAVFQGASAEVVERAKEEGEEDVLVQSGNALEMAIVSSSKRFIRSPSCQKVIEGIWSGRIIYSAMNARALIADNYKTRPIQMYNPHKAPVLDHYRLKVPRVRSIIEYSNFLILFCLYVLAIQGLEDDRMNGREVIFIIYASAFSLDKLAAVRERGVKVFTTSLVNGFDLTFMLIFGVYFTARVYGFHHRDADALRLGADWLAIGAVLIFPRLAFVTLADNLMVLSIRSMLIEFFFLMGVAVFCFLGFVYALFTLSAGKFDLSQIGWWLLEVYFGLDASGFESAHEFHPFLGPLLMVSYALLSNTLLLTVLVAILGNTFATINADAAAESMYRKAVSTLEGVKADAVFSYSLPFNLLAVVIMWPMRYILNARWFHKLNVMMIRITNLPALLLIALYERQQYKDETLLEQLWDFLDDRVGYLPRKLRAAAGFDNFSSGTDIGYVFEIEREVGSFYKGWDDDHLDEVDEGGMSITPLDLERSLAALPDAGPIQSQQSLPPELGHHVPPPAETTGIVDTLKEVEDGDAPRSRVQSMPSHPPSPSMSFPTGPRARNRRNSSIHEPSPLARLFIRSPDRDTPRRRQTMAGHRPSTSIASVGDLISPRTRLRSGGARRAVPVPLRAEQEDQADLHQDGQGAGAALDVMEENPKPENANRRRRGVRFPTLDEADRESSTSTATSSPHGNSPSRQETPSRPRSGANTANTRDLIDLSIGATQDIPAPRRFSDLHARRISESSQASQPTATATGTGPHSLEMPGSPPAGSILLGKASDIAEGVLSSPEPVTAQLASVAVEQLNHEEEVRSKLEAMEERQKRMEGLLMRLIGE